MKIETEIEAVQSVFEKFVEAVKSANFSTYLDLHAKDVAAGVSEDLFVRNSERARAHDFSFELEGVDFDGRFATVRFSVTANDGAKEHNDNAQITLIRDDERWALYET